MTDSFSRREFLGVSGAVVTALAVPGSVDASTSASASAEDNANRNPLYLEPNHGTIRPVSSRAACHGDSAAAATATTRFANRTGPHIRAGQDLVA